MTETTKSLDALREETHYKILALFFLIVSVSVGPLLVWQFLLGGQYRDALLSFTLIATPMVTFFGFIWISEYLQRIEKTLGVIRTAITASIISEYFVLLALTIFIAGQETQFPLQKQLVDNFTTVVGVVIAFYFGSAAYNQGKGKEQR